MPGDPAAPSQALQTALLFVTHINTHNWAALSALLAPSFVHRYLPNTVAAVPLDGKAFRGPVEWLAVIKTSLEEQLSRYRRLGLGLASLRAACRGAALLLGGGTVPLQAWRCDSGGGTRSLTVPYLERQSALTGTYEHVS